MSWTDSPLAEVARSIDTAEARAALAWAEAQDAEVEIVASRITEEVLRERVVERAAPKLLAALKGCDRAFAAWQAGQIPGRPEDILALVVEVREAIAAAEGK